MVLVEWLGRSFGLGDIGLFLAYSCIGARLTLLMGLCLAPVFALLGEWAIFHQPIRLQEGGAVVVTLLGIGLAITGKTPSQAATNSSLWCRHSPGRRGRLGTGNGCRVESIGGVSCQQSSGTVRSSVSTLHGWLGRAAGGNDAVDIDQTKAA